MAPLFVAPTGPTRLELRLHDVVECIMSDLDKHKEKKTPASLSRQAIYACVVEAGRIAYALDLRRGMDHWAGREVAGVPAHDVMGKLISARAEMYGVYYATARVWDHMIREFADHGLRTDDPGAGDALLTLLSIQVGCFTTAAAEPLLYALESFDPSIGDAINLVIDEGMRTLHKERTMAAIVKRFRDAARYWRGEVDHPSSLGFDVLTPGGDSHEDLQCWVKIGIDSKVAERLKASIANVVRDQGYTPRLRAMLDVGCARAVTLVDCNHARTEMKDWVMRELRTGRERRCLSAKATTKATAKVTKVIAI